MLRRTQTERRTKRQHGGDYCQFDPAYTYYHYLRYLRQLCVWSFFCGFFMLDSIALRIMLYALTPCMIELHVTKVLVQFPSFHLGETNNKTVIIYPFHLEDEEGSVTPSRVLKFKFYRTIPKRTEENYLRKEMSFADMMTENRKRIQKSTN